VSVPTSISAIDILTADRSAAIGSIGDIRDYVSGATVKGRLMQGEGLTVTLAAGVNTFDAIRELAYGQVLDISTWTNQYFISKVRRNYPDLGGLQIEARAYYERLKFSRCKRTYDETKRVDRVFTIYAQTPEEALDTIMDSAPSGFAAGSVTALATDQKTAKITLSLEDDTHWTAIEKLCGAIEAKTGVACEFTFTRNGDTYEVDLVQQVGISGNRSVKAGGGSVSSPSNRLNLQRITHGDDYFSRMSAVMGDEAENITLGRDFDGRPIHWNVQTATPGSPSAGRTTLTLSGEPVPYDDWGTGAGDDSPHYFGNDAEGFFAIGDSTYPNTIVLQTGTTEIEDGYFASDSQGTALDYIRASDVEGDYGIVEKKAPVQGAPVPNLIRRAGDSDDMETFVSGVPDGWVKILGATTVAQVTDERYAEIGTNSCQVQAAIGGGIRSGFYTVRGGLASCLVRVAVEAGEVQVLMRDEEGNTFPGPDEGQAISSSRALQSLAVGVWNTFEGTVAVEILATKPGTVFYVDAATLTPSNGSYDWQAVMGGRELWAEAGRILTLDGGVIWNELSGSSIDLSEVTGFTDFDAFELGALVTIQDGYNDSVHDVNFSTRVLEFEKSIVGSAYEARWTAERVRDDFIDYLRAGKPVRPRPVPQTPVTPRYPPRLSVEREDVADADGGGNPGVTFTLFPKTSKNEDLENWEIFVSVDGEAFSSLGTDEDSLVSDPDTAYFIGGGYASSLGTTAQPTYSVVYPPDDGSVKSVRFYVVARSTGLASEPVEYLVRNPEIAAGQITGTLISSQLGEAAQSYGKTFAFSSADADTVAWGAGVLTMASGAGFNINAGNTGDMVFGSIYFIYLDPDTSTTDLQVSTTNADAVGSRKVLLAVAQMSLVSASAFFQDAVGILSLTNEQLAVDSILAANIKANQIAAVHMTAASIETLHLAANAVTTDKLNFTPLISTSGTGSIVATINATAEGIRISAGLLEIDATTTFAPGFDPTTKTVTILDNAAPTERPDGTALVNGDQWRDTDDGRKPYSWSGTQWFADYTIIDGGNIDVSTRITVGTGNNVGVISGADATYRIWAGHATAASATFRVTQTGVLTATGATITGSITATSGAIGGWTVGATTITGGDAVLFSTGVLVLGTANDVVKLSAADATYRLWVGNATAGSAPFRVSKTGALTTTALTATGGTIAGWDITNDDISKNNLILDSSGLIIAGTGNDKATIDATNATYRFWIGNATAASAPFRVTNSGALVATSATITGAITATSGSLEDLDIDGTLTMGASGAITNSGADYTLDISGLRFAATALFDAQRAIQFGNGAGRIYGDLSTLFIQNDQGGASTVSIIGNVGVTIAATNVDLQGATTINSQTVWYAGNDGAGSGLDADKLDSFEASVFHRNTAIASGSYSPSFSRRFTVMIGGTGYYIFGTLAA